MHFDEREQRALQKKFQRTIQLPITKIGEKQLRESLQNTMNQLLQHQNFPKNPLLQEMFHECLQKLRQLQNFLYATCLEHDYFSKSPWDLQSLCSAANVLLQKKERSLHFSCEEKNTKQFHLSKDLNWLLMELICNAALHNDGKDINVSLQAHKHTYALQVSCTGTLSPEQLNWNKKEIFSGAASILQIAKLHQIPILWFEKEKTVISLLRLDMFVQKKQAQQPNFFELIDDHFSLLHIALSPAL